MDQAEWEVARPGTWSRVAQEPTTGQAMELAWFRPGLPGVGAHTHPGLLITGRWVGGRHLRLKKGGTGCGLRDQETQSRGKVAVLSMPSGRPKTCLRSVHPTLNQTRPLFPPPIGRPGDSELMDPALSSPRRGCIPWASVRDLAGSMKAAGGGWVVWAQPAHIIPALTLTWGKTGRNY